MLGYPDQESEGLGLALARDLQLSNVQFVNGLAWGQAGGLSFSKFSLCKVWVWVWFEALSFLHIEPRFQRVGPDQTGWVWVGSGSGPFVVFFSLSLGWRAESS